MREHKSVEVVRTNALPEDPDTSKIYYLEPVAYDQTLYLERTDRNIGWITPAEQQMLHGAVVGIAGCGGMGGLLAATLVRLGVGEVRIADCEDFDLSNLNRQFAATRATIARSKALATAHMLRAIADDTALVVYPQGITPETARPFLEGCDIVCDEIEFWAVGSRILLHQEAGRLGIPLLNCSTVGFGTRLFLFDHAGMSMETMLGFPLARAYELQTRISTGRASHEEVQAVLFAMLNALIPELPEYGREGGLYRSREWCIRRLREECRAPIIATNPPMASGFIADHALLYLLGHAARHTVRPPKTPGYLYFDAAFMRARRVLRKEILDVYT